MPTDSAKADEMWAFFVQEIQGFEEISVDQWARSFSLSTSTAGGDLRGSHDIFLLRSGAEIACFCEPVKTPGLKRQPIFGCPDAEQKENRMAALKTQNREVMMHMTRMWPAVGLLMIALTGTAVGGELAGKFGFTPQAGVVMPIQFLQQTDGGGSAKFGFAAGATAEYFINENLAMGGRFVFNRLGVDIENVDDGNWTILEFGIFAKYVLMPGKSTRPFVRGGAMMGKAKQELTRTYNGNREEETDITGSPGFEVAGGILHEVAENISVYGEIGYSVVATDGADADRTVNGAATTGEMEKHLQWVGVKAGATFFFGSRE